MDMFTDYIPQIDGKTLPHISATDPQQDMREMELRCLGQLDPINLAVAYEEPKVSFESFALDSILGSDSGQLAVDINDGLLASSGNTVLQYRAAVTGGGLAAIGAASNFKLTSAKAYVYIESIRAEQDSETPAVARLMCHLLRDGTTAPNIAANGTTITGSIALADKFALGPVYDNGTLVPGLQSVEYNSGLVVTPNRGDGETIASDIRQASRRHELRLGFKNMALPTAQGLGLSDTNGAVDMYLRHIPAGGGRTADATSAHIRIRFSSAKFVLQTLQSGGQQGEVQAVPTLVNTGTVSLTLDETIPFTP